MPGSTFTPGNQEWRLNDLYACPSNRPMHRSTAWNGIGSAWFPYCYFGWVTSWQPGSRTALADQTLTDRRLAPDRLLMQDLVLDQRDHGAQSKPLPYVNHARSGRGGQTVAWSDFAGANQLWGDGHVRWAAPADFAWDGVIAKTGLNQVYGWGDRYWFAAQ